jgi:hypothetical protein
LLVTYIEAEKGSFVKLEFSGSKKEVGLGILILEVSIVLKIFLMSSPRQMSRYETRRSKVNMQIVELIKLNIIYGVLPTHCMYRVNTNDLSGFRFLFNKN